MLNFLLSVPNIFVEMIQFGEGSPAMTTYIFSLWIQFWGFKGPKWISFLNKIPSLPSKRRTLWCFFENNCFDCGSRATMVPELLWRICNSNLRNKSQAVNYFTMLNNHSTPEKGKILNTETIRRALTPEGLTLKHLSPKRDTCSLYTSHPLYQNCFLVLRGGSLGNPPSPHAFVVVLFIV